MNVSPIIVAFWSAIFLSNVICAQVNCGAEPSKKASKMLNEATTSSKLNMGERLDLLKASVETDSDCMACLFAKARAQYQIASEQYTSYSASYTSFAELISKCPEYHADAYYYAGIIAYGQQEYESALNHLESFLLFDKTKGKTSRDQDKKEMDVAQILPEIRFFADFYANPVPFDPVRLLNINSPADEYLPVLSPDNTLIFFTRKAMVKAKGDLVSREVETFMVGTWEKNQEAFQSPEPLPPPFNVGDNYGGASLSLDNREMFVTVCKPVTSSYKNCDIYVSRYERKNSTGETDSFQWSGLQNLGEQINTPDGWEAQPSISADGNTLYFATIRENTTPNSDGNPTIDIYYTTRSKGEAWSEAKPLSDKINTAGNDKSPFLHTDSRTLYFSSNGRPGAGGYDIYFSRQDETGTWSSPKNMGYPINSEQDEHGLIVSTDGSKAFFATSNAEKAEGLDIFSFAVPQKARPEKILILKGDVSDENGNPVADARIELKYTKSKEAKDIRVDSIDGSYAAVVNLRSNEDVLVSIKSETKPLAFNSRVFSIADSANTLQEIDMEVAEVENGMTYRMNDIRFATNSSDLDEVSKGVLDAFAEYLNENPGFKVEINGHTDNIGDSRQNLVLSTDRAFEVFGYLQDIGVNPLRMRFKGYGDTRPLLPNTSPENRAKNRRTEFTLSLKQ